MREGALEFSVMGPVRVWRAGAELAVRPPQVQLLLAVLLAHAGEPVSTQEAIDVFYGADPPASAVNIVHRHVATLRRLLDPDDTQRWLRRDHTGYSLRVDADSLDLLRFRALVGRARTSGDVSSYAQALALWRGYPTAGLPPEAQSHPVFARLEREWPAVAVEAADAALASADPLPILAELRRAADRHPLDEPLQTRLILTLAATGHQAEAIETHHRVRALLRDELGVPPGTELAEALRTVLSNAPSDEEAAPPPGPSAPPVLPAQLPADLPSFAGRSPELARLLTLAAAPGNTLVITAIGGMAGIGKTTLAVHLAHRVAALYPDGQLYVNLRGFGPSNAVADPGEVLRGFLDALGVAPGAVPDSAEAQAALYRSALAGRRMLVLLDNARDVEQVRPLLPGAGGCLVLVTSRNVLAGLIAAEGAHPVSLDVVSPAEARDVLVRRLGADRVEREEQAAARIVARCGRLPLALAVAAARAAMNPGFSLAEIADELSDLDALDGLRSAFSWSYGALTPGAARLFRLMAAAPGPDLGLAAAASLAGVSPREVRPLVTELTRASLAAEHRPGRFALHDLLRVYGAELGAREEVLTSYRRLLDHHLGSAVTAAYHYTKTLIPIEVPDPVPGVTPQRVEGKRQAREWFEAEHAALRDLVRQAARTGHDRHVWQLVWAMEYFLDRLGHWGEAAALSLAAVEAANRLGDPVARAHAHKAMGRAHNLLRHDDDARMHLQLALNLFETVGDRLGQASTAHYFGWVDERQGRNAEALAHSEHALGLYQALGDRVGQAMTLNSIGSLLAETHNPVRAEPYCRAALRLFQDLGDRHGEAAAWDSLGLTEHLLGRHQSAMTCYNNALALFREEGARHFEAVILDHLGDAHHNTGNPTAAHRDWQAAIAIYTEIDQSAAQKIRTKLLSAAP